MLQSSHDCNTISTYAGSSKTHLQFIELFSLFSPSNRCSIEKFGREIFKPCRGHTQTTFRLHSFIFCFHSNICHLLVIWIKLSLILWWPVLVKFQWIIFTNTELIKLFVHWFLRCLINWYIYSLNNCYMFYILFFYFYEVWNYFTCLAFFHSFHQLFFLMHKFLSKSHTSLQTEWNPITL